MFEAKSWKGCKYVWVSKQRTKGMVSNDLQVCVYVLIHGSQVDHNLFEIDNTIILKIYFAKKLLTKFKKLYVHLYFSENLVIFLLHHFRTSYYLLWFSWGLDSDQVMAWSDRNINTTSQGPGCCQINSRKNAKNFVINMHFWCVGTRKK